MNIIVSSKHLAHELSKIDFENDIVLGVQRKDNGIMIFTRKNKWIDIVCECGYGEDYLPQVGAHWDCVRDTLKAVPEQPTTLTLEEGKVIVKFYY